MDVMGRTSFERIKEVTLERQVVVNIVKRFFKRWDFPSEIHVVLADTMVNNKGDVVWANLDNEHLFDFAPIPCIDELVLNLPTKEELLAELRVERIEDAAPEAEEAFWDSFEFQLADRAGAVRVIWE
ncbi:hypothetical protein ACFL0Q_07865 [Thermodesulfobacteriota bacterium]